MEGEKKSQLTFAIPVIPCTVLFLGFVLFYLFKKKIIVHRANWIFGVFDLSNNIYDFVLLLLLLYYSVKFSSFVCHLKPHCSYCLSSIHLVKHLHYKVSNKNVVSFPSQLFSIIVVFFLSFCS